MKKTRIRNILSNKGFTLIEVIVTIVVAGILGTILVVFMGTNIVQSGTPVNMVRDQYRINQVMENIVADYKQRIKDGTLNLGTFPAAVQASGYWGSDVSFSSAYVSYSDGDGNGVYDEATCSYGTGCKNLKITLSKGYQKITALFTE
jgi:prepilin-type N-terminal cleavage/methylation domain-containing protein